MRAPPTKTVERPRSPASGASVSYTSRKAYMPRWSGAAADSAADSRILTLLRIRSTDGKRRQAQHQTDDAGHDRPARQVSGQLKAKRYRIGAAANRPGTEAALRGGREQDRANITGPPLGPPPRTTGCV